MGYWHTVTPSPEGKYAESGLARVKRLMHNHVPPGVAVALTAMAVLCIQSANSWLPNAKEGVVGSFAITRICSGVMVITIAKGCDHGKR